VKAGCTTAAHFGARGVFLASSSISPLTKVVALEPVLRRISHPYSDVPAAGIVTRCYAYAELFGEKVRALGERARPRDLYDVVNLFRRLELRPTPAALLEVLTRKCAFKSVAVPSLAGLADMSQELVAAWQDMLGHQLPVLPPFESFWSALPEFFDWLSAAGPMRAPSPAPLRAGEHVLRPAVGVLRRQGVAGSSFLESIRFAAANCLCVELDYVDEQRQRGVRVIEPYSLRQTLAGDILLMACRADSGVSRSYRLDRVLGARVTQRTFVPRFAIELTASPSVSAPLSKRGVQVRKPSTSMRDLRRKARSGRY
jgi:hypothetical protein